MFRYKNRLAFIYDIITNVCRRPSWIVKFPPMGLFGTFSMSFCIICWTYSEEKNQPVTNALNVYHVIRSNGLGL